MNYRTEIVDIPIALIVVAVFMEGKFLRCRIELMDATAISRHPQIPIPVFDYGKNRIILEAIRILRILFIMNKSILIPIKQI
jgi:hypothetical protein